MKKLLAILLAGALLLGLAGCSTANGTANDAAKNTPTNSPVEVAIDLYEAIGKAEVENMISCMPEYNFSYIVAAGKAEGWEPEAGLSDKEAVVKLFEERLGEMLNTDNAVASMDITGEELAEADYPSDLLEKLRYGAGQTEGMDASLLDAVEAVSWVELSGTITYADGTSETEDDGIAVPCVKIGGVWYADLFALLFMPTSHAEKAPAAIE